MVSFTLKAVKHTTNLTSTQTKYMSLFNLIGESQLVTGCWPSPVSISGSLRSATPHFILDWSVLSVSGSFASISSIKITRFNRTAVKNGHCSPAYSARVPPTTQPTESKACKWNKLITSRRNTHLMTEHMLYLNWHHARSSSAEIYVLQYLPVSHTTNIKTSPIQTYE